MSKSATNDWSRINMTDSDDEIAKKLRRAVTDSDFGITYDRENRPGVANLLEMVCGLAKNTFFFGK